MPPRRPLWKVRRNLEMARANVTLVQYIGGRRAWLLTLCAARGDPMLGLPLADVPALDTRGHHVREPVGGASEAGDAPGEELDHAHPPYDFPCPPARAGTIEGDAPLPTART